MCQCIADGSCNDHLHYDPIESVDCIRGYTIRFPGAYWAGIVPPVGGNHTTLTSMSSPCNTTSSAKHFTNNMTEWVSWTQNHEHIYNRTRKRFRTIGSETIAANPIDVAPYVGKIIPGGGAEILCFNDIYISSLIEFPEKGEFFYDLCVPGYCKADITEDWIITDVNYPCDDNREGILCGQCKPGYAVKPQSWVRM